MRIESGDGRLLRRRQMPALFKKAGKICRLTQRIAASAGLTARQMPRFSIVYCAAASNALRSVRTPMISIAPAAF